jgi:nitrogen fixation NifU-like protein
MTELEDLYQEVILDHYRSPRNHRALEDANHRAEGYNPLCGDRLTVYLKVANGVITEATFEGSGCAISQASASVMTTSLKGKTREEAKALFERFRSLVTGEGDGADVAELGELAALSGVSRFPTRVKCATLAWHSALTALSQDGKAVFTED